MQKRPVSESSGASLAKRSHLESRIEACPGDRKSADGSVSARSADAMKKGAIRVSTSDVLQSTASSSSSSSVLQVGMLSCFFFFFLDKRRSITPNRCVLNMVQGHHLQLSSHPPRTIFWWC